MPSTFTLHSNDLGGVVRQPQRHFSVGGGNRSPQLSWTNPPEGTKASPSPFMTRTRPRAAASGTGWPSTCLPPSGNCPPARVIPPWA
ncbi:MAG: hypothetical protein ACLSCR_06985 [Akkermansia sp.]